MYTTIKRGDIWIGKFKGEDSEQKGIRPCIIISNDIYNLKSPNRLVIPTTGELSKNGKPVHVRLGKECGLIKESIALVDQQKTITKRALIRKVGFCTEKVIKDIEMAIKIQAGIIKPVIDINYIKNRIEKIKSLDRYINKQLSKNNLCEAERLEKTLLLADFINYCSNYNIDHIKLINFNNYYNTNNIEKYLKEAMA